MSDDERDNEWDRLKLKIEEGLVPAEECVAQKLKAHIADADTPSSLVAEFERYSELMKREGLKRTLRGERESLLSVYRDLIGRFIQILRRPQHLRLLSRSTYEKMLTTLAIYVRLFVFMF